MTTNIDLRQLAVRRSEASPKPVHRSRHLWTRYVLPGTILAGFVAVLGWSAREYWLPARTVTVVPVVTARLEVHNEGTPLFQSAGWVEPRPTPVLVTALTEGVVEKLFVVEGQKVKEGDKLAQLVEADAALGLRAATADLELRQAERDTAHASLKAARSNLEKPIQLQASLAEAEALLAQKETDLTALPFQITVAKARVALTEQVFERKAQGVQSGAVPTLEADQAKNEWVNAQAGLAELQNRQVKLQREVVAQKQRRDAMQQGLELKIEVTRAVAEAEANYKVAEARCKQAEVAVAAAKLRLERTLIRAPVDGMVLALIARPGSRLMGQAPTGQMDASTVVSLYDPNMLQVRADVRLEDVPRVQPGQRVKVETPSAPAPLEGEVLRVTSQADIQKNTLQVKVALKNPPLTVRPDMLVQVTFLAVPTAHVPSGEAPPLRLFIPKALVESGPAGPRVLVADLAGRTARVRMVKLGQTSGDLVEITEGLNPADKVIAGGRHDLQDGQRIHVASEERDAAAPLNQAPGVRPKRLSNPANPNQDKH